MGTRVDLNIENFNDLVESEFHNSEKRSNQLRKIEVLLE